MSVIASPAVRPSISGPVAPEDLLQMEDQGLYELVDGRVIAQKTGYLSNEIAGEITRLLGNFAKANNWVGCVLPEQSFQCFDHKPNQVRRPDIAFILPARVPPVRPEGHVKIVPDIAVEVVSPGDSVYELDDKLSDYRLARIPLVWVINPEARIVRVYRLDQMIEECRDGDMLRADPVLPTFAANVTELLPPLAPRFAGESPGKAGG